MVYLKWHRVAREMTVNTSKIESRGEASDTLMYPRRQAHKHTRSSAASEQARCVDQTMYIFLRIAGTKRDPCQSARGASAKPNPRKIDTTRSMPVTIHVNVYMNIHTNAYKHTRLFVPGDGQLYQDTDAYRR